ncbi:hypothetical protein COS81_04000 [candidate division WWE3 bacterium CG06_land_8_20_14_3_00_42_16]|uniref:Glycosyltransferase RgtA/B/C/D-like domain-containing protein n=4 Tax=Katanobacteria TaxID=422282 RepID=A0A2M7AM30_UNCKA|nr:MAG: hypothetical protein AUJ38_02410 [bacterium CG1_02_42_9]PIU68442.1 MAG: hypothetical protein COS81_04000 [candidate division WWE3 bacterium CG06_land_8_20_14_3_00_42_16]PIZ42639.1 MAG: hypothetical protein COY34_02495 [candidate division WWE3 bacterium CG_4_10_14_0_2_um_filter_42_8]PJA37479.1 MAG: hypothetical protein CO181_03310 [candidate division WWE3 bacterium CG_4_9_14_3_um_filter_43_9]PJC67975.1 MAG: hypothetical protein CO015_05700 [candidate division WWE3 bacterium CG_4_8_14_3_u
MPKLKITRSSLIFGLLISIFLGLVCIFFLTDPPVWPDEALYADIAANLATQNRLGSNLWQGVIPGIETHALFYPPVFFYTLALQYTLFGVSILAQRLFSVLAALGVIVIFYAFSRRVIKSAVPWFSLIPVGLLVFDFMFLKAARLSRPEIFVLFWGMLALYLYRKATDNFHLSRSNFFLSLSGLSASLAFLNHPVGIFVAAAITLDWFLRLKTRIFLSRKFYLFSLCFLLPVVLWILSLLPNFDLFLQQFSLAVQRKSIDRQWLFIALTQQPFPVIMLNCYYLALSLFFAVYFFVRRRKEGLLPFLLLAFAWAVAIYGKQNWYYVLPLPFLYLAGGIFLAKLNPKKQRWIIAGVVILPVLMNLWVLALLSSANAGKSYAQFSQAVASSVPEKSIVFLSSIPDPYFGFKMYNKNVQLYEFPVLQTPLANYEEVLNKCDYVVFNGSYEEVLFGDFLVKYLETNQSEIVEIGQESDYQTLVVKLKPQTERQSVL